MGVDGVPVDPVTLVLDQPRRVELACGHHIVVQFTGGALVAVDRQLLGEEVEVLALLELGERRADDGRVEHPDVGGGGPVGGHLRGVGGRVAAVVAVGDALIGQAVGLPCCGN